jgi:hypothetical protein
MRCDFHLLSCRFAGTNGKAEETADLMPGDRQGFSTGALRFGTALADNRRMPMRNRHPSPHSEFHVGRALVRRDVVAAGCYVTILDLPAL